MKKDDDDNNLPRRAGGIGYGRPPIDHQFKKGQSGNPRGRPRTPRARRRRAPTPASLVLKEALRLIRVQVDGKSVKMTVLEASVRKLAQSGLAGDARVLTALVKLALAGGAGQRHLAGDMAPSDGPIQVFAIPDNGRDSD